MFDRYDVLKHVNTSSSRTSTVVNYGAMISLGTFMISGLLVQEISAHPVLQSVLAISFVVFLLCFLFIAIRYLAMKDGQSSASGVKKVIGKLALFYFLPVTIVAILLTILSYYV